MGKALNPDHTPYHPKWYRRRIPIFWWLGKRGYVKFITRELTSPFVVYAVLLLLAQAWSLAQGQPQYQRFQDWLALGPVIAWHILVLAALIFHSITWLNLAPSALVLRLRGARVPDGVIRAAHFGAWAACSALMGWFLLGRV